MFEVKVDYIGDDIEFEMLTENSIASDKRIGTLRVKLSAMCVNKGVDDWWGLNYNDKVVGQVHMSSHWKPHGVAPSIKK